jgi:hypothetical protein
MSRAPQFVAALDVGKRQDFSALAILHYRCLAAGFDPVYWRTRYDWDLHLRRLTRFPLGTSYRDLPGLVASELRSARLPADSPLLIDATGVGEALVDHLSCGLPVIPVILTPGDRVSRRRGRLHVPKPHLVRTLASLLEDGKLAIAARLPLAAVLRRELETFELRLRPTRHLAAGAFAAGAHDDLVIALALAAWYARHQWPDPAPPLARGPAVPF